MLCNTGAICMNDQNCGNIHPNNAFMFMCAQLNIVILIIKVCG